jgi:hypothetical protein
MGTAFGRVHLLRIDGAELMLTFLYGGHVLRVVQVSQMSTASRPYLIHMNQRYCSFTAIFTAFLPLSNEKRRKFVPSGQLAKLLTHEVQGISLRLYRQEQSDGEIGKTWLSNPAMRHALRARGSDKVSTSVFHQGQRRRPQQFPIYGSNLSYSLISIVCLSNCGRPYMSHCWSNGGIAPERHSAPQTGRTISAKT